MPTLWAPRAAPVPCPRPLSGLPLSDLPGLLHPANGDRLRENAPAPLVLLLRGMAKGASTARLARELGVSRKQLHTLRQRVQAHLNATAPTEAMVGTAFEADEL